MQFSGRPLRKSQQAFRPSRARSDAACRHTTGWHGDQRRRRRFPTLLRLLRISAVFLLQRSPSCKWSGPAEVALLLAQGGLLMMFISFVRRNLAPQTLRSAFGFLFLAMFLLVFFPSATGYGQYAGPAPTKSD